MGVVDVEVSGDGVAVMVLNRPDRLNALSDESLSLIPERIAELEADDRVRCTVITGAGKAFCAGADLEHCSAFASLGDVDAAWLRNAQRGPIAIRKARKPTIAAVNGVAVGAGFGLALAADIRVSAPTARFGAPFVRMGAPPDYGVSYFLPKVVGTSAALDILLTARLLPADEARALGIVSTIADDVLEAALETARVIAGMPPEVVAVTRENVYRGGDLDVERALQWMETNAATMALHGREFAAAFEEYRSGVGRR